ncbi:hypothetical protein K503DRAFT_370429 [Rhizopogon vinicolor AM-OR11-026]|uniref:Uncharacterized protein n=1 Tax=Rhizopogon vinicolor AM-OR11-026 TaxID=1314800 RepID=A0A1B7MS39_9AGAM|nr:hypothetical protein K503DRAFT_370429 [Rhizopogon vinicolor AM-OR11-026]
MYVLFAGVYEILVNHMKLQEISDIPPRNGLYPSCVQLLLATLCLRNDTTRVRHPSCHVQGLLHVRSSAVSDARESVIGSVIMIVGVGETVADIERRTVILRLFMRPYPADNDCKAIVVELVGVGCDGHGDGNGDRDGDSNGDGEDNPTWSWVRVWSSLIDVRNEVICAP